MGESKKPKLYPDSSKALKEALCEGATHWDTLSFCRPPIKHLPPTRRWGDLFISIDMGAEHSKDRFEGIKSYSNHFLGKYLKINLRFVAFHNLDYGKIGIQIPSSLVRMEDGDTNLPQIYRKIAYLLKTFCEKNGLKGLSVESESVIHVKMDLKNEKSEFLTANEFNSCDYNAFIDWRSRLRKWGQQTADEFSKIDRLKLVEIKNACIKERVLSEANWSQPVPLVPLNNGDRRELEQFKCAVMILQNVIVQRSLIEFQGRDALRFVRGTYPEMQDVNLGLDLLVNHYYITRCHFPEYSYPGRRPSEWYVVNPLSIKPMLHGGSGPFSIFDPQNVCASK